MFYNMKKIRIGNDIRLKVNLISKKFVETVQIQSIKAYIINTTAEAEAIRDMKNKTKFMSRFPIEPKIDAYTASAYDTNACGFPTYHAFPQNHVIGSYAGFGVEPNWFGIYRPIPQHNLTEFLAPVKYTSKNNRIEVFYPAEAQRYCGDHKLILVAKIYEPGYSPNNLRTITMDYENIFTLVDKSSEGTDSDVVISVGDNATSVSISGEEDILVGKIYTLSAFSSGETVKWHCTDPYVQFVQTFGNMLQYRITAIPEGDKAKHTFTIFAVSSEDETIFDHKDITAHNYATGIVINDLTSDIINLDYRESATILPKLIMEDGSTTAYYLSNGIKKAAFKYEIINGDPEYIKITESPNYDWSLHIENYNTSEEDISFDIRITSLIPNPEGDYYEKDININVIRCKDVKDVFTTQGEYNNTNHNINLTLTNGDEVAVDMSNEFEWYEHE